MNTKDLPGMRQPIGSSAPDDEPAPNAVSPGERSRGKKKPRPVTPSRLEQWALAHLQRYATSAANLRTVLLRKAGRNAPETGEDLTEVEAWIDALLPTLERSGYVDDGAYARGLARRLHGRGCSHQLVRTRLRDKGLSQEHIEAALEGTGGESGDFAAAFRYARRRGLGPFREDPEVRSQRRERDMAAFARAGFSYEVTTRILDAKSADELEEA